jgi:hypothetical protein
MAEYTVHVTGSDLTLGALLLFIEGAQLPDQPARRPLSGDTLAFDMANGDRFGGSVLSANDKAMSIAAKGRKWALRPANERSLIKTSVASTHWKIEGEE